MKRCFDENITIEAWRSCHQLSCFSAFGRAGDCFCLLYFPCLTAKQQLNTYASELCRTAEVSGCVGNETNKRTQELTANTGISPDIQWSHTGKIQEGNPITVTCTITKEAGLWGGLGSFPVTLHGTASGKSEVYWK